MEASIETCKKSKFSFVETLIGFGAEEEELEVFKFGPEESTGNTGGNDPGKNLKVSKSAFIESNLCCFLLSEKKMKEKRKKKERKKDLMKNLIDSNVSQNQSGPVVDHAPLLKGRSL